MLLSDVADASAEVAATSSRKAKVARVARVLTSATSQELPVVVTWLAGDLRQRRTGLGWSALHDGPSPATTASLQVLEVDEVLTRCEQLGGTGSRTARITLLHGLLARGTPAEHRLVAGLVTGELRQGAAQGVLLDAVAAAAGVQPTAVRRAVTLTGDVAGVAVAVLAAAAADRPVVLAGFGLAVGQPLSPMLAQTAASVGEALARTGPAAVEWKLDGVRVQIHRQMDEVRIWTRTLDEVTSRLPEVVERVRALPVGAVVLDGEVIALRPDGRPRPLQETAARVATRRPGGTGSVDVPLSTLVFDVLHLDGKDLVDVAASDRRRALESIAGPDLLVPRLEVPVVDHAGVDAAQAFADDALAMGHEGVVVKALDAPYAMGRRGAAWVKVKPRITLDLVVLAAEWGHGRRTGWLSNLHLGARDPQGRYGPPGGFVMLGKTFKGMTDELLRWQTARLQELATTDTGTYRVDVRPELVVEIALDGAQTSPRYPAGLALRFARVLRYRPDKSAAGADTVDTVRQLLSGSAPTVDE